MAMVFRWMVRLTVLVLITILCAGALVYYLAAQSLPNYAQNLQFSGAKGSIEIIRDTANVPHIKAENDHDIFFALGFVHAQDRLWQMAMLRRTAQGRLSEVFGAGSLESDKLMRRVRPLQLRRRLAAISDSAGASCSFSLCCGRKCANRAYQPRGAWPRCA